MLTLVEIRTNPELVKQRLAHKHYPHINKVDEIVIKDSEKRNVQTLRDQLAQQLNQFAQEIGKLIASKNYDEVESIKAKVSAGKVELQQLEQQINLLSDELFELLVELPNLPLDEVPVGTNADDNELCKQSDISAFGNSKNIPHWEVAKKFDIVDFEIGAKNVGSGFPYYKNMGAVLQRRLIDYFLDFNRKAGYTEYQTPLLVNKDAAFATGQLPDKEGQMYYISEDDLFLIPTAEVTLTNIYRDSILKLEDLPIKLTGHSACFRREAGSYGKDVRGLNRLHQFDKVEIVQIVEPSSSMQALVEMVNHVEALLVSLKLPYRILRLCGGDMGFAAALTYDFEVYSLAQQKWLEVSSVSNFATFQSNRLNLKYKTVDKKNELAHTLNGSSLALPRIMAALLEFYQVDGGIKTPDVLIPYLQNEWIVRS